jgi:hypothetical protein
VISAAETTKRVRASSPCVGAVRNLAWTWGLLVVPMVCQSLVCSQPTSAGQSTFAHVWPSQPQIPHPAVVRVVVQERGSLSHGSGTLVDVHGDYGLVITNWHVILDSAGEVVVVFPDGFRSAGRVLKADRDWDLAVVAIWRPPVGPMPMAPAPPRPGDVLTIAGYGQGDYRAVTGRCTQYVAPAADLPYEMVEVSASARLGDSGGPIINRQGQLAGVLFGSNHDSTSGSYVGRVRQFLTSISQHVRHHADTVAQSARPHTEEAARVTSPARITESGTATPPARVTAPTPATADPTAEDRLASRQANSTVPIRPRRRDQAQSSGPNTRGDRGPTAESDRETQIITWGQLAGESVWDQAKSVLAIIGLFSILHQLTRRGEARG